MIYQTGDLIVGKYNIGYISKIDIENDEIQLTWLLAKIAKIHYHIDKIEILLNTGYKHISVK